MLFVLLSALTVMNMLIGVLCEVVTAVAAADENNNAIKLVKDNLFDILHQLDEDGSGLISREEVLSLLKDNVALAVLRNLSVNVQDVMDQLDMFFEENNGGELPMTLVMELILTLRGDRPPTMRDMLHGQSFSRRKTNQQLKQLADRLE